jgi:transcriptional regulator with XRE-family HTH domain
MQTTSQLARRLSSVLRSRDLTQAALSESAGVTREMVNRYVCGRATPTITTLRKLANALEVDPSWLIFGGDL